MRLSLSHALLLGLPLCACGTDEAPNRGLSTGGTDGTTGEAPTASTSTMPTDVETMGATSMDATSVDPTGSSTGDDDDDGTESTGSGSGGESGSSSTGTPASCGDGVVDSDEECDLGDLNDDGGACTSACVNAVCGDGLLQVGIETCDDAGESAACNDDCSAQACGDGLLNVTAGEACDHAGESPTCDIDCTAQACGDAVVNVSAGEECDGAVQNGTCDDACLATCDLGFSDCDAEVGCESDLTVQDTCTACGLTWETVTLNAVDDVSISDTLKGPDNRLAAYTNTPGGFGSVVAYLGFDTTAVSDDAVLTAGRVFAHHETGFGNPFQNPVAQVIYADANDWTFDTIDAGGITPGVPVSGTFNEFVLDDYNEFPIDPAAWDYRADLLDDWLTLGLDETGADYHYVYFYGVETVGSEPYLELDVCQ